VKGIEIIQNFLDPQTRFAKIRLLVFGMFAASFLMPQVLSIPVKDADAGDYHPESFWYFPWGKSGVHKGVDIFAPTGRPVLAATYGLVISTKPNGMGGNVVWVLGPKWRMHYYAHLNSVKAKKWDWVWRGEEIGTVGTSGNARGKAPHLHYHIQTIVPYPWRIDPSVPQGWQKMWYLNPINYF
jgi:murein DD-endopeptidase MepM/ murein hydrolase activator NlpD